MCPALGSLVFGHSNSKSSIPALAVISALGGVASFQALPGSAG